MKTDIERTLSKYIDFEPFKLTKRNLSVKIKEQMNANYILDNLTNTSKRKRTRLVPNWSRLCSEFGNQSQINQIVVINLTIVIHIQKIVNFFPFFIVKSYSNHFQKKAVFLIDYVNNLFILYKIKCDANLNDTEEGIFIFILNMASFLGLLVK